MILKAKVNDSNIQYQPGVSQDAYFVEIIHDGLCVDKPNFQEFWVKMAKLP